MKYWCAIALAFTMIAAAGPISAHPGGEPSGDAPAGAPGPGTPGDAPAAPGGDDAAASAASPGDLTDQGLGTAMLGETSTPAAFPYMDWPRRGERPWPLCVGYYAPTGGLPCR